MASSGSVGRKIFDTNDVAYRKIMEEELMRHYFAGLPAEHLETDEFRNDLTEHQYRRVDRFHTSLIPWLGRCFDLRGSQVIEIGSGTGSSTMAFAPYVDGIHCFEIAQNSIAVAKRRLAFWGFNHVTWEEELFTRDSALLQRDRRFDVVLLVAVLEHLFFREFKSVLALAFEVLRPGGVILVAETPNRLSVTDYHTSWIDFFQWLPRDVALEYYQFSPRQHFVNDMEATVASHGVDSDETTQRLVRWGGGVSYHDFELVLGPSVHDMIVLDGWEDEIRPLAPIFKDDDLLLKIFDRWNVRANRAFARSWLYFVIRKPD